jgi:hypothetical protein
MIKRYLQFIKEQKSSEHTSFISNWPLTDDKYEELFIDMIDSGFTISPQNVFIDATDESNFEINELAEYGKELIPCKVLTIIEPKRSNNDDLTDSFKSAIEYIESIEKEKKNIQLDLFSNNKADHKYKVILKDDNGILDIDSLVIGNDISIDDDMELEGNLQVLIYDKDVKVKIGELELMEYYNWKVDEIIENHLYIHISQENLAYYLLGRNEDYVEELINGIDYDKYDNSDFRPNVDDLFRYHLDTDNQKDVIKILVDEIGFDEMNSRYDLDYTSYDDLVEFLLKERFYSTLNDMCENTDLDLISDIRNNYSDLYLGAICAEHDANIETAFDKIVADEIDMSSRGFLTTIKDRDANVVIYKIKFNIDWLDDLEYDDLKDKNLIDIFNGYADQQYFSSKINPSFSDFASIDDKEFNADVKHTLKWYQKKDTE